MRVESRSGSLVLSLHLPFAEKGDIELGCGGGELFLAVGPHRRAIVLPDSLSRRDVAGARFVGERLEVEFVEA
jgi:arsenite-transporting ATPase